MNKGSGRTLATSRRWLGSWLQAERRSLTDNAAERVVQPFDRGGAGAAQTLQKQRHHWRRHEPLAFATTIGVPPSTLPVGGRSQPLRASLRRRRWPPAAGGPPPAWAIGCANLLRPPSARLPACLQAPFGRPSAPARIHRRTHPHEHEPRASAADAVAADFRKAVGAAGARMCQAIAGAAPAPDVARRIPGSAWRTRCSPATASPALRGVLGPGGWGGAERGRVPWSGVNPEACDLIGDQ